MASTSSSDRRPGERALHLQVEGAARDLAGGEIAEEVLEAPEALDGARCRLLVDDEDGEDEARSASTLSFVAFSSTKLISRSAVMSLSATRPSSRAAGPPRESTAPGPKARRRTSETAEHAARIAAERPSRRRPRGRARRGRMPSEEFAASEPRAPSSELGRYSAS